MEKAADLSKQRISAALYWLFGIAVLAVALARLLPVVAGQLVAPHDLISESTNLATIDVLRSGGNVYDPQFYLQPPFILTLYTPCYFYVVSWLPASQQNPFLTGRVVSMIFMLGAAGSLLLVEARKPGVYLGLAAVGLFLLVWPVTSNTAFLTNTNAALCFSALGVVAVTQGHGQSRWIVASSLLCTLAMASKQNFAAAPVACFLYLLFRDVRSGVRFGICFALLLTAFCLAGYFVWGHGFYFSVVEAVRQPMSLVHFSRAVGQACQQPSFVPVFGGCLVGAAAAAFAPHRFRASPFGYYALTSWIVLLATLGKLGSSSHYFIEPCLASLMFAAGHLRSLDPPLATRPVGLLACAALGGLLAVDAALSQPEDYSFRSDPQGLQRRMMTRSQRNQVLAALGPTPKVLNLAGAHLTGDLPGEVSIKDPYLYYLLWTNDQLPETSLIEALESRYFDVLVAFPDFVMSVPEQRLQPGRWSRILNSVYENYPVAREGPDVIFLLPKQPPDPR